MLQINKYSPNSSQIMGNCTRCGKEMDGEGMCSNCASLSSPHNIGTPEEVPCQRCGMYLPPHELRMWNSRLYCAYCIMDIQDEDARSKGEKKPEEKTAREEGGGLFSGLFGKGEGKGAGSGSVTAKADEPRYQQYRRTAAGTCERCGRESDVLYLVRGRKLCPQCVQAGGEVGASPSFMGQIVTTVKKAIGIREKPKIIPSQSSSQSFDIKSRKMIERKETAEKEKEEALSDEKPYEESPPKPPPEVFDVTDRKFSDKKEGMEAQQPISESAREEKKPAPKKIKKLFFKMHPSGGSPVKKK